MAFVMLNPSSANAEDDDPTIRRCMGFARREGCGGVVVLNLYALRTSRPADLVSHPDPEGPLNASLWGATLDGDEIGMIVAAWGSFTRAKLGASRALAAHGASDWQCLGTTSDGSPCHPLYLRRETPFRRWLGLEPGVTSERGSIVPQEPRRRTSWTR